MAIQGVSLQQSNDYTVCYVDDFSDELKQIIREELCNICYGRARIEDDQLEEYPHYSYAKTLTEFLTRFNGKNENQQKGLMGELLAHILIKHYQTNLEPISIFFNKEDRSEKKGFDVTYRDTAVKGIWYGEVKSGAVTAGSNCNTSNNTLLGRSKRGLVEHVSGEREHLWESVLDDVERSFAVGERRDVQSLLKQDIREIKSDPEIRKNGILVSVLFHDVNDKINHETVGTYVASVIEENLFDGVIVFSIQKQTLQTVHEFLTQELEGQGE